MPELKEAPAGAESVNLIQDLQARGNVTHHITKYRTDSFDGPQFATAWLQVGDESFWSVTIPIGNEQC